MSGSVTLRRRTRHQSRRSCIRCNMPELTSNQLLILAQRPDATTVAGYRAWQSLGRQVRPGAKGIGIFGYSTKTSVQEVTDSAGHTDEKTTTRMFFPVRTVFDIGDTDGDDTIVPTDVHPCALDEQGASTRAYQRISAWLIELGWDVQRANIAGAVRGYTSHADNSCGSRTGSTTSTPPASCCTRRPTWSCTARTADSSPPSSTRPAAPTAAPRRSRPTAPPTCWPTCSAWTPATPPSGTSQAGQPQPPAAPPTPRRSPPRSAAPRPPSCTPSTPSPRRSAWTTENNPRACPVRYRAGQAPRAAAQRPLPRHTGRHHPLPTAATTPYPRRPRCDRERGAVGAAGCRWMPV